MQGRWDTQNLLQTLGKWLHSDLQGGESTFSIKEPGQFKCASSPKVSVKREAIKTKPPTQLIIQSLLVSGSWDKLVQPEGAQQTHLSL